MTGLFSSFLRLGCTSFGGPAMIAYIRRVAVDRQRWLEARAFDEQDPAALLTSRPAASKSTMARSSSASPRFPFMVRVLGRWSG